MADPCPECGKDRVLVGYRHLCVTQSPLKAIAVTKPRAAKALPATKASVTGERQRCAELEAEVKHLKRLIAEQGVKRVGRPPLGDKAMSGAERVRRMRAKRAIRRK
jgi:hypothetical protein